MNVKKLLKYYHNKRIEDLRCLFEARIQAVEKAIKLAHKNKANNWQMWVFALLALSGLIISVINLLMK